MDIEKGLKRHLSVVSEKQPNVENPTQEGLEDGEAEEIREKSNKVSKGVFKCSQLLDSFNVENLFSSEKINENIEKIEEINKVLKEIYGILIDNSSAFFGGKQYLSVNDANTLLGALEFYEKIKPLDDKAKEQKVESCVDLEYELCSVISNCLSSANDIQKRLNIYCYSGIRFGNNHPDLVNDNNDLSASVADRKDDAKLAFDKLKPLFELLQKVKTIQMRNGLRNNDDKDDPSGEVLEKIMHQSDCEEAFRFVLSHFYEVSSENRSNILFFLNPTFGPAKANKELEERVIEYKRTEVFGEQMAKLSDLESIMRFIYLHVDKIAIEHGPEEYDYHDKEYLLKAILELITQNIFTITAEEKGLNQAIKKFSKQVREKAEKKLSGEDMISPLTRHVGDFNLRAFVLKEIKDVMLAHCLYFEENSKNPPLRDCLKVGLVPTIWYFQRNFKPDQVVRTMVKNKDGMDEMITATGQELLDYAKNRPRGFKNEKLDKVIEYLKENDSK